MTTTIALAGNPNSGKTTMFNDLTGSSQHVGNWPGVTVEKKEGRLKGHKDVIIQDLPGIYSLSPYSPEEVITRNYLITEQPSAIINIVDASNIERNLYLTTQLTELGIPVVLALNMIDIVRKRGDVIDTDKLSEAMGCAVVETSAVKGLGSKNAAEKALWLSDLHAHGGHSRDHEHVGANHAGHEHHLHHEAPFESRHRFSASVEEALKLIGALVETASVAGAAGAGATATGAAGAGAADAATGAAVASLGAPTRWFAIKLFERDSEVQRHLKLDEQQQAQVEAIIQATEQQLDDDSESIITNERYTFVTEVIAQTLTVKDTSGVSLSDRIDRVVTNRLLALPIFALIMFVVYYLSISTVGTAMNDWVNEVLFGEVVPGTIESFLVGVGAADWLQSLILDGIVAGVGAVIGFLPQMLTLFLLLALLEDCGYMARIAFIMDRIFKRFGLSGKSFIPILIGTGCGVPGILASRTIENESNRRLTVMTTTFIPCSAKLPIIALIVGALFPGQAWVATSTYFIGMAAIIVSGIILKKTRWFAGDPTPFVIELPAYHLPRVKGVARTMAERGWAFVKRAGTIILLATIVVWFLSSFNWTLQMVDTEESMLAALGSTIAFIFSPLGWGDWRATVATITGLIAKENVVGTFGVLYGFAEVAEDGAEYWPLLAAAFTQLSAFSFLLFNLLCAPCFAAIGAISREMGSARWTAFAVAYECVFAYLVAFTFYQIALLVTTGVFTVATALALLAVAATVYLLARKPYSPHKPDSKRFKKAVAPAAGTS